MSNTSRVPGLPCILSPLLTGSTAVNTANLLGILKYDALRGCADHRRVPLCNDLCEGFKNKQAELVARNLGKGFAYHRHAQRRGTLPSTLAAWERSVVHGTANLNITPSDYSSHGWGSRSDRKLTFPLREAQAWNTRKSTSTGSVSIAQNRLSSNLLARLPLTGRSWRRTVVVGGEMMKLERQEDCETGMTLRKHNLQTLVNCAHGRSSYHSSVQQNAVSKDLLPGRGATTSPQQPLGIALARKVLHLQSNQCPGWTLIPAREVKEEA